MDNSIKRELLFAALPVLRILSFPLKCSRDKPAPAVTPPPKQTECAPPPPDPCNQAIPAGFVHINQKSFNTLYRVWPTGSGALNLGNLHFVTRDELGAAEALLRTTCDEPALQSQQYVAAYLDGARKFFEQRSLTPADPKENGVLVDIGGLAPAAVAENAVYGALEVFRGAHERHIREGRSEKYICSGKRPDPNAPEVKEKKENLIEQENHFSRLLKACYHFNKAAEVADQKTRFIAPRARRGITATEKKTALEQLAKMEAILIGDPAAGRTGVVESSLSDTQKKYLFALLGAAESLRKSLGGGKGKKIVKEKEKEKEKEKIKMIGLPPVWDRKK